MAPKIAIVYYSMYGHIKQLVRLELLKAGGMQASPARSLSFQALTSASQAEAEKKGIEQAGGSATLLQYAFRLTDHWASIV